MSVWVKAHWKKLLQYVFFIIIAFFGSLQNFLSFLQPLFNGISFPAIPINPGGISIGLIASIVGILGLAYLIIRDATGARGMQFVLKPSDRVRFSVVLAMDGGSAILLAWGVFVVWQFWSASSSPSASANNFLYGILGSIVGAFLVAILTVDLVGGLRGKWLVGSFFKATVHELVLPRPSRTQAVTDFLSLLYRFRNSWTNTWEAMIRLNSMQPREADEISELASDLSNTHARIHAEGTSITPELEAEIQRFLKGVGELNAFMPAVLGAGEFVGLPTNRDIFRSARVRGDSLTKSLDGIIPRLEHAFPVRREGVGI